MYCGGLSNGISEELMQRTFSPFGQLYEIRVFKDKGFAFIRFANKEAATNGKKLNNLFKIHVNIVNCVFITVYEANVYFFSSTYSDSCCT